MHSYSKENVRTVMSFNENDVFIGKISPVETFQKNIDFINEKYKNDVFGETQVLLTSYPIGENENVSIITCRDMTCIKENKLFMYMAGEINAKKLLPQVQDMVDNKQQLSNEEMFMFFSHSSNYAAINDDDEESQLVITHDAVENFSEYEIEEATKLAFDYFLENKHKTNQLTHKIINIPKNNKEFGFLIVYDQVSIRQLMLGTYHEVVDMQKQLIKYFAEGFSITHNNQQNFLERCELKKKLRKKKRDERRRKRR